MEGVKASTTCLALVLALQIHPLRTFELIYLKKKHIPQIIIHSSEQGIVIAMGATVGGWGIRPPDKN